MKEKTKKAHLDIDFKELDKTVDVLTFMQNDYKKIVEKEKEIHNDITALHTAKEEEVYREKEKVDIILNELVTCCEKKKKTLENYVKIANDIIKKNNELIEKEKIETTELIQQKDFEIQRIQNKIDYALNELGRLNASLVNLVNSLNIFLNYKTQGKVNIKECTEIQHLREIKETKKCSNITSQKCIRDVTVNNDNWSRHLCAEYKKKLYESIDTYRNKIHDIKRIVEEGTHFNDETFYPDNTQKEESNNVTRAHLDKNYFMSTVSPTIFGIRKENEDIIKSPLYDNICQKTTLLLSNMTICDASEKEVGTDIHTTATNSINEKNETHKSFTDENKIETEENHETLLTELEKNIMERSEGIKEKESEKEIESESQSESEKKEKYANVEEANQTYETKEEEEKEEKEEKVEVVEETSSFYDSDNWEDSTQMNSRNSSQLFSESSSLISSPLSSKTLSDNSRGYNSENNSSKESSSSDSSSDGDNENESVKSLQSRTTTAQLTTKENRDKIKSMSKNDSEETEEPITYKFNSRLLEKKTDMFLTEVKNMDYDYLSYFEQKLRNS